MTKSRESPFAALEALRAALPPGKPSPTKIVTGPPRAVVRYERKKRGGKEVTLVEKLALPAAELEIWCRELKQALGCGGAVDGETIVLQGDLRQRLPALLSTRGVQKVTVA